MITSTSSIKRHLGFARFLATFLDSQFSIGGFKFGMGPIIGIIPWIGDVIENSLSFYLVWLGLQMNLPSSQIAKMIRNIALNFFFALFPFIGNIGDFIFKSNLRNLAILEQHAKQPIIEGEIIESERLGKSV